MLKANNLQNLAPRSNRSGRASLCSRQHWRVGIGLVDLAVPWSSGARALATASI